MVELRKRLRTFYKCGLISVSAASETCEATQMANQQNAKTNFISCCHWPSLSSLLIAKKSQVLITFFYMYQQLTIDLKIDETGRDDSILAIDLLNSEEMNLFVSQCQSEDGCEPYRVGLTFFIEENLFRVDYFSTSHP